MLPAMYSFLSLIECYLVNLDTYQVGLLQVSHGASLEKLSNQEIASDKISSGIISKSFVEVILG